MFKKLGLTIALLSCLGVNLAQAANKDLTVFAAASTTNALTEITKLYETQTKSKVALSFASSSTLAKQIENGAPVDIFLSANAQWMNYLGEKNLLVNDSRMDLLGNSIVLIVPVASEVKSVSITPQANLIALLGKDGRLSVGDPTHVSVGSYAQAALEKLKLWKQISQRIAPAKDVRAGLTLVERNESPLGIVYASDAAISEKVRIVGKFPKDSHPNVDYPIAAIKTKNEAVAQNFIEFLSTSKAKEIWAKYGFEVK